MTEEATIKKSQRPHCICGTWLHAHENDTGKCLWPDCGCSRFQLAEDAHEPTVEEALKELREMFPPPMGSFQVSLYVQGGEDQWRISGRALPYIGGQTIGQCMAQVRKWRGSQS